MTSNGPEAGAVSYGRRLVDLAERQPHATAFTLVTDAGTEQSVSWQQLDWRSNRVARVLAARGIGPGDMVTIELPNSVEHVVASFGAWKVGACVLPLRWDLPDWGQRVRAIVVSADSGVAPTAEELRRVCRERVAPYEVPARSDDATWSRKDPRRHRTRAGWVSRHGIGPRRC